MTTEIQTKAIQPPAANDVSRRPYYRVISDNEAHTVEVFLPGVAKDDYQVSLDNDQLLVEGKKVLPIPAGAKWLHREIATEPYKLRLQLNVDVDANGVKAKGEDGILRVVLPVAAETRPRRINIQ